MITIISYNICVRLILNPDIPLQLQIANILSWIIAVLFSFWANRTFVFYSKNNYIAKEIFTFFLSRIGTLFLDMILMFLFVSLLKWNDKIIKLIIQVFVIFINYITSRFLVFKKDNN